MSDPHPMRLWREEQLRAVSAGAAQVPVPPPYHVRDVDMLYLLCRFDPVAARSVLPPGIELHDSALGVITILTVGSGWAIAPYTGCYMGLQVKGFDAPDGYPGLYNHTGLLSGVCGSVMSQSYNDRYVDGWATLALENGIYRAEAGPAGRVAIRASARHTDRVGGEIAGVNSYLGALGHRATGFSAAYATAFRDVEDVSLEILDDAPETMRRLEPLEIVWPLWMGGMTMTLSAPRFLDDTPQSVDADILRVTLFDVLSRIGRPAMILARSGRAIFVNDDARALFEVADGGESWLRRASGSRELSGAVRKTIDERTVAPGGPVVVDLPDGRPLVAQVLAVGAAIAAEPAALVLLTDPGRPGRSDPADILQLLGLTRAEARLAKLVGQGQSPRAAAETLSITEGNARTTLKAIFSKLDVSRQSQLAQIVTRLEAV